MYLPPFSPSPLRLLILLSYLFPLTYTSHLSCDSYQTLLFLPNINMIPGDPQSCYNAQMVTVEALMPRDR